MTPLLMLPLLLAAFAHAAAQSSRILSIAHRGASSVAPENTIAAFRKALDLRADALECDIHQTKDGHLVILHDDRVNRTTNGSGSVGEMSLEEIRRLDAGSWFDPKFKNEKVLTFQEAIDLVKGKAGIYPETKAPDVYGSIGFDMEKLVMDVLVKNGLDKPGANPKTPVIVQSFSADSLKKMVGMGVKLPLIFLVTDRDRDVWLTKARMAEIKTFAAGVGPSKSIISGMPEIVGWAHDAGLSVTPYTFRSAGQPAGKHVRDEMNQFLNTYGVDALFTDNPDQFPRK